MKIPFYPPHEIDFPDPRPAIEMQDGLVCLSADLSVPRLLVAYRQGIFPWIDDEGLFYWFATAPRAILLPEKLHIGRSLHKTLRRQPWQVSVNQCFEEVISACASVPRKGGGTWISENFQAAYTELHRLGFAHSFECYFPDAQEKMQLAGGFYGVQIGSVFYGESMFSRQNNASKIALAAAVPYLAQCGVALIDCQQESQHTQRFGAELIDFDDFQAALRQLNARGLPQPIGRGIIAENIAP